MNRLWMFSRCGLAWCVALAVLGGLQSPARAELIVGTFSGVVDSVDPVLAGTFSAGQVLTGTYTFESTTAARGGSNSNFAAFDALTALSFTVGGYPASSGGSPEIQVDNAPGAPNDRYAVVSRQSDGLTGPSVNGNDLVYFFFRLDDSTDAVFTDALILPTSISLADFNSTGFFLFFNDGTTESVVSGHLTSFSLSSAIPEPAAWAVWLVGLTAAGAVWRIGRRR